MITDAASMDKLHLKGRIDGLLTTLDAFNGTYTIRLFSFLATLVYLLRYMAAWEAAIVKSHT